MSMKNGYCIKCHTANPKRRIFKVNSDAEKCYCPHCLAEYQPKVAINHFNRFINGMVEDADMTLKIARMPDISYGKYAEILEFDSDNVPALLGRLSSLLYLSTLRHSRFNDVVALLDLDLDRYHLVSSRNDYGRFLKTANDMANSYRETMIKRLTFRSYFYDPDCVILYLKRIKEIIDFKLVLQREFEFLKEYIQVDIIKNDVKNLNESLKVEFITALGNKIKLVSFDDFGDPSISTSKEKIHTGLEKYRNSTLDLNDKKLIVIKDEMFKSNKTIYHIINLGLGFGIALGSLGLTVLIVSIFFWNKVFFWPIAIVGLSIVLIGAIFILIQFILRKKVRKNR